MEAGSSGSVTLAAVTRAGHLLCVRLVVRELRRSDVLQLLPNDHLPIDAPTELRVEAQSLAELQTCALHARKLMN